MQNAQHSSGPMRGRSVRALCRERGRGKVAMQKIADWLGQLGLSEYARRFADNAIDLSVIRRSAGASPQLLRAIAQLEGL